MDKSDWKMLGVWGCTILEIPMLIYLLEAGGFVAEIIGIGLILCATGVQVFARGIYDDK